MAKKGIIIDVYEDCIYKVFDKDSKIALGTGRGFIISF